MNLLFITNDNIQHYVLIKDFNTFMSNQTSYEHRKYFCMYHLQGFSSESVLNRHRENCISINAVKGVTMPNEGDTIEFTNFYRQTPVPFVIYADFEAISRPISSWNPTDSKSYTETYQSHQDCGYGYKVVCCYGDKHCKPIKVYRDENAAYEFMKELLKETKWCKKIAENNFDKPLVINDEEGHAFQMADGCHVCKQPYFKSDKRVRDHCHITGKYKWAAHTKCSLSLRIEPNNFKILVIFHNLKGYESHFICNK